MTLELHDQMRQFIESTSVKDACDSIIRIAVTSKVPPFEPALGHGIAYVVDRRTSTGYLVSPTCIHMALKQRGLDVASSGDWQRLELLTLFMIQHVNCEVTNCKKEKILLPKASDRWDQEEVGALPLDLTQKSLLLIHLAHNHPVIDAIMVDRSRCYIYFIQTSFSAYANHKTKKADLFTKCIEGQSVFDHYTEHISTTRDYESFYIYATPQAERKVNDADVYFLDLSLAAFRWT